MSARKLPSPQTVNRLYWMDGLTTRQIAKQFACSLHAVRMYMRCHRIPMRKKGKPKRQSVDCVDCGKDVCRIKAWNRTIKTYRWIYTVRCLEHHRLYMRKLRRNYKRKVRQIPEAKWRGPLPAKPTSLSWARDD